MSRRDQRFKPLKFCVNSTNTAWVAEPHHKTYVVAKGETGYIVIGTFNMDGVYSFFSDAKSVCQLDWEARIKEWLA
jgi:hypothetical protein